MADQKVTDLTADTSPTDDDLFYMVNDPAGTPGDRKVAFSSVKNQLTGRLLAVVSYNPGTTQDKTTTSATPADVDSTNLSITFTAPASGNVLINLTSDAYTSNGQYHSWNLRTTGGSDVSGTSQVVDASISTEGRRCAHIYVTGLTPGASTTYRWGFAVTGSNTAHVRYGSGSPNLGPAVMEVWSAP